ncbi:hypothetical protein [Stutzerimonas stutzeri]|uniref:MarR family transcriptional regulator n=1 Tax=Stutzerimonas stutzeri TaxID=316 RepID=A0A172WRV3_STUST|nr:hypothetical protein [Stutzerimonas stutzeri]ANF26009.1 hypothetical protein PS273GM_13085 [Stutzerimonas stutzeri]
MNNPLDQKVLDYLKSSQGSTAWAMTGAVGADRKEVSKACQRLKRKGLVKTCWFQKSFWKAVAA